MDERPADVAGPEPEPGMTWTDRGVVHSVAFMWTENARREADDNERKSERGGGPGRPGPPV